MQRKEQIVDRVQSGGRRCESLTVYSKKHRRQLARRDQQASLIKALFMGLSFVLIAAIEIVAIMLQLNLAKVGYKYVLDLHDYLGMQQWSPTLIAARKACIACDSFALPSMS